MVKMSDKEKKKRKEKMKCFADLVDQVPTIITHTKYGTTYERLHFIGSGSYGKCFEVAKMSTKERFACKILSKSLIKESDYSKLVQNEISIQRKLKHPHIVELLKSFEDDKLIYMIQALCSNHTLRDLLKARGVVSIGECRYFVSQILKGAEYIHQCKYIHRDLKLTNILIDRNMQMKICDFGLAIRVDDKRLNKTICGTTNYLAPEVVSRQGFVYVSDVWAIGVIAFVLLFGYKPFEEHDAYATHQRILRVDYTVPSDSDSELKYFLRCVFQKEFEYRSNATECLQLAFFRHHDIPYALPIETITRASYTETNKLQPCIQMDEIESSKYSEAKPVDIGYPEIHIKAEPILKKSYENVKYAQELDKTFTRLDVICHYIQIDPNHSFNDLSESDNFQPDYWIAKWSFDINPNSGFAYQLSDGTTGVLFHDGLRLMRTPDKARWALDCGNDRFWRIRGGDLRFDSKLAQFNVLEARLERNGVCTPETIYNSRRTTYLYTWLQTDKAVIMLLNNNTIQINFMYTHKKVIVSMDKQKITFVTGRMSNANFRTVSLASLTNHGYSLLSFAMLKNVTAAIQHLADKLKEA